MNPEQAAVTWIRTLLNLPAQSGERLNDEWQIVRRRIEAVHGVSLSNETDPAGAPRLETMDE